MERSRTALIGLGEAGVALGAGVAAIAYDRLITAADTRGPLIRRAADAEIDAAETNAEAVVGATLILSLVTADQALAAARETAASIAPGAIFCDLNSVAPSTKRAAAHAIDAAGGRYVDVAVMAPVDLKRLGVPVLVAGPHREEAMAALRSIGFTDVSPVDGPIGSASAIKMIRSVVVKGLEALSIECAIAARAAGVLDQVVASLDASWPGADWERRFDYNLDRMMVHGCRRAAEMEESLATLTALGVEPAMTRGTIERQRALGKLHIAPPDGLAAKLAALAPFTTRKPRPTPHDPRD